MPRHLYNPSRICRRVSIFVVLGLASCFSLGTHGEDISVPTDDIREGTMSYWLHRISHHAEVSHPLLERGYLSIGWSDFSKPDFVEKARV